MDPRDGRIHLIADTPEATGAARRAGLAYVGPEDAPKMKHMNRKQRRAWAAKKRQSS